MRRLLDTDAFTIKELQFDIFGFSRGAAAARHFANRVFSRDSPISIAVQAGLGNLDFRGDPAGKIRFLGIFDTVAAIGTPYNGFNPHSADCGDINLLLRPGVADKVFHITAQHECRFNFALNSVKPAWPELALPGAHSDIGGGYNPEEREAYFLTRPQFVTVPLSTPDNQTRLYRQTEQHLKQMKHWPTIAPIINTLDIRIDTWYDDRMPTDRYGTLQKRSGAAAVLDRTTRSDWSKVALRVMLDAAEEAGVVFKPMDEAIPDFILPRELLVLNKPAISMGRAARNRQPCIGFTSAEINMLAKEYLHCSANWNSIVRDTQGMITGAVKPAKLVSFINRPDQHWQRTVYNMEGQKI